MGPTERLPARRSRCGLLAGAVVAAACLAVGCPEAYVELPPDPPRVGQIVADLEDRGWLRRAGGEPVFICGAGDPEGFLYRGERRPDGTRDGDQEEIIQRLAASGANAIYIQAVRSHGGDGEADHNPFVGSEPEKSLDEDILAQWDHWFGALDDAGVVIHLFLFDDGAHPWDTGDRVGKAERDFVHGLVDRFEHVENLIWVVGEEYQEAFSPQRASNLALEIKRADDFDHLVAVHKLSGNRFEEFADDPNMDQFLMQLVIEAEDVRGEVHEKILEARRASGGRYLVTLAELAEHGTGLQAWQKSWAAAMAGAYVLVYEMHVAGTPEEDLRACGTMVEFMEATDLVLLQPRDELAGGAARYVLAGDAESGEAVAYAEEPGPLEIGATPDGRYRLRWLDVATRRIVAEGPLPLSGPVASLERPADFGDTVVVHRARETSSSP